MQQREIVLGSASSAEYERRAAIRTLAQLDAAWLATRLTAWPATLDAGWVAVLLCYFAVFGGILIYSDFLPYTFDNNESFSAFWHARNMYEYGIANSSGLADESFSYDPAAHPYVYTHAGASPRLFAYLLYVLGIRTIELQIAVTVFTVGLLAFWFAYRFLAEISTRLYATIACLLLMTDYIMFVQWHIGAWHVWKMFLLFGGLYLAQRVAARKQAYPLLAVYAFHAFLFYYETIFNVYVAAAVFLYFVFVSRDWGFAIKFGSAQFAGALTAAAILLGQLVLQFGWEVVRTDIYYTFIGRNFATDSAAFLEAVRAFYAEHNIVFWLNAPDADSYRNLLWALRVLFRDHAVHTPPWSLVLLAFAAAEIVRRLRAWRTLLLPGPSARALLRVSKLFDNMDRDITMFALLTLGVLSAAVFYILASHPEIGAGLAPPSSFWLSELLPIVTGVGILAACIFVLLPTVIGRGITAAAVLFRALARLLRSALAMLRDFFDRIDWEVVLKDATVLALFMLVALAVAVFYIFTTPPEARAGLAPPSSFWIFDLRPVVIGIGILYVGIVLFASPRLFTHPGRIVGASAFVAAVFAFLLVQSDLYAGTAGLQPVWRAALVDFAGYTTGGALFVSVLFLLAAWYASGSSAAIDRGCLPQSLPDRLLLALAALLVAYFLVYFVFAGYVLNGYFARYLSLTIYFNDLLLALGLVAMIDCIRGWYARFEQSIGWRRIACGTGAGVAAFGLAGVVVYWGGLQAFLLRRLPPDEISFFQILSTPPFRGSTFAASLYGAPVAYFSNNWAYEDGYAALAKGSVTLGLDGYEIKRDSPYVWFADRADNAAYGKPEYFLAKILLVHEFAQRLRPAYLKDEAALRPRAGDVPLVRAIREGRTSYLHPVEVARDPSPLDRWSIVRLDWDFPPFLRPLEGGEFVTLDASATGDGTRVHVDYRYAHQDGVPEASTRVTLFTQSRCAGSVPLSPLVTGTREFDLPHSFVGTVHAEVQPTTATKAGPIYRSGPLKIGSTGACREGSAVPN